MLSDIRAELMSSTTRKAPWRPNTPIIRFSPDNIQIWHETKPHLDPVAGASEFGEVMSRWGSDTGFSRRQYFLQLFEGSRDFTHHCSYRLSLTQFGPLRQTRTVLGHERISSATFVA